MLREKQERFRGCLLGGAVGDALGFRVDSLSMEKILEEFGPEGIQGYDLANGYAEISAHTQTALFTANGLLFGNTRGCTRGVMAPYVKYVEAALRDWAKTQRYGAFRRERTYSWLSALEQLHARRGAEIGLLDALNRERCGTMEEPVNNSKSCGGFVRVPGIALFFDESRMAAPEADRLGAEAAALTHGNPLGFLPGAAYVRLLRNVVHGQDMSLEEAVLDAAEALTRDFSGQYPQAAVSISQRLRQAVNLARNTALDPWDAVEMLGGAITAEEVLAAGVYAALREETDFDRAVITAVNHSGHSAAVGYVTGTILGAALGASAIPDFYLEPLELTGIMEELADDLVRGCPMSVRSGIFDDQWDMKYVQCSYDGEV